MISWKVWIETWYWRISYRFPGDLEIKFESGQRKSNYQDTWILHAEANTKTKQEECSIILGLNVEQHFEGLISSANVYWSIPDFDTVRKMLRCCVPSHCSAWLRWVPDFEVWMSWTWTCMLEMAGENQKLDWRMLKRRKILFLFHVHWVWFYPDRAWHLLDIVHAFLVCGWLEHVNKMWSAGSMSY